MADQPFTVTLPSNSNMAAYPTNRGSKYTVKLSAPLNFSGQTLSDDVDWQVALTSMQYTNRFYEMREPAVLYVAVVFPSIHAINIRTRIEKGVTQYAENLNANSLKAMMREDQRILKQFLKVADTADSTFVVRINILVPTGHYSDPSAVYKVIVSEFNRLFSGERFGTTMKVVPTGTGSGTELLLEPSTNKLFLWTEHAFLVNTLGMAAKAVDTETPAIYQLSGVSTKASRFDTVHSLYIYSDIVKPQHVGDTLAPLLEVVPVQGTPGQRIHYSFSQLTYLPVNRTYIESIDIEIYDEYGNPVVFSDEVENVVCRLRFRRSKHSTLML